MKILGIDIGGSGIKGALVDTDKGELLTDRSESRNWPGRFPTITRARPSRYWRCWRMHSCSRPIWCGLLDDSDVQVFLALAECNICRAIAGRDLEYVEELAAG